MKHAHLVTCLLAGALFAAGGTAQSRESDVYGSWMKRPQAEWPKIAVVNQIDYVDRHHPVAGCGFLLEAGNEVLAATAKHVLTYFKSARMDSVDFRGTLKSWKRSGLLRAWDLRKQRTWLIMHRSLSKRAQQRMRQIRLKRLSKTLVVRLK